jgi:5'(3')-deoxyribonucleotidase
MTYRPLVLMDVDGVLSNFSQAYCDIAEGFASHPLPPESDWREWDMKKRLGLSEDEARMVRHELGKPGVALNMRELPHAVAGAKRIMEIADVYFVTSPIEESDTWCYDRLRWLSMRFGFNQARKIVQTYHKQLVYGAVLIDDKVANIEKWGDAFPNSTPILWTKPWNVRAEPKLANGRAVLRATDWGAVYNIVKGLQ